MKNQELVKIFIDMARYLQAEGVAFKPYAYQKAATSLEALKDNVAEIYKQGGKKALMEISGIGKVIADYIEEYLKTGKIKIYEDYKKKLPINLDELTKVEGMGVKKAKVLYQKLKIKNLKDLEKAAKTHKIAPLFGFGEKTEKNILQGLEFLRRDKGRFLIWEIMPAVNEIYQKLKNLKEVEKISLAGSVRRRKETIGDVDMLIVSKNPEKIMDFFTAIDGVEKIWGKGATKSSIRMKAGFDIDLRVVPERSYGSALQYFTGSKEHNIATRKIAIEKGLKLSEYGVFRGGKQIAGKTEEDVYEALGMAWVEPELRENEGEIEAALNGRLPKLVKLEDIKGDLHCHTNASDGNSSLEDMVIAAENLGYEYIGISDHTKSLNITDGLDEGRLLKQNDKIRKLNDDITRNGKKIKVLHGCEVNILKDGSLDIKDEVLSKLDYVIASIHSFMKMEKKEITKRIIKAIKNPNVDILGHPSGRIVGRRDEYNIDFNEILQAAKETGKILEINSNERLDLKDVYVRQAKNVGVKMVINTDAHKESDLELMQYGVFVARRGWAEKSDIINTNSVGNLLSFFKN